jgi:hypothetical protein
LKERLDHEPHASYAAGRGCVRGLTAPWRCLVIGCACCCEMGFMPGHAAAGMIWIKPARD